MLFGLFNYLSIYPFNYFNCYGYFAARKSTAFDGTVDFEKWVLYHAKSLRVGGFFCVLFSGVIVVGYNVSAKISKNGVVGRFIYFSFCWQIVFTITKANQISKIIFLTFLEEFPEVPLNKRIR